MMLEGDGWYKQEEGVESVVPEPKQCITSLVSMALQASLPGVLDNMTASKVGDMTPS